MNKLKTPFLWKKKRSKKEITQVLFPDQILKAFFHFTTDAISISDLDNNIVLVNHAFEQYYGWSMEEIYASPLCFIPDEYKSETKQLFDAVRSMGVLLTNYETIRQRKDGTKMDVILSAAPIKDETGKIIGASCITRDISDRKKIEETLRQTEAKYRLLIDHTQDIVTIYDLSMRRIYASPSIEQLGFVPAEVTSPNNLQLTHPEDIPMFRDKFQEIMATKQPVHFETRSIDRNGNEVSFETRGIPILSAVGDIQNIMLVSRNVTERKYSEAALFKSEKTNKIISEYTDDLILITDKNGDILYLSPSHSRVMETNENNRQLTFADIHPEDRQAVIDHFHHLLATQEPKICEFRFQTKSNKWIVLESKGAPILTKTGDCDGFIIVSRDITERRHNEELLRKAEKLSVIGELAAGIAHEIRNPLTSLKGFIQFLYPSMHDNQQYADIMLSELDRINFIVSELLVLAKPHSTQIKPLPLIPLLENVLALLKSEANLKNIDFRTAFNYHPIIAGEENQLKQVFINIIKNAIEAIDGHGEVLIATTLKDNHQVLITLTDTGCGISEEMIHKLGAPFFTTKENGTGLGLMISSKIMKDHNGSLEIKSREHEGTVVEITLPIVQDQIGSS
ncbi:PAS domain S-box protein [Brevibacillus formosus]|uniref:PAS domain-containing sensor histidine kinase n=1 Tax=Brevibacillus TaxID=55080 RepID=UPI000D0F55EE|nr:MULTISPECIES: PAS domain-containing sensor histidine kinase [Brevibacillus]MBG9940974.1 sporulation kinase [Brevibacillus formosus]MED1946943.1 PAS domain S-box protein [Brevibacillus formosus]MED2001082.1 PAS domain S-box protein [Brevibacillus formosus]MED2080406.1 PAS domain S-box protein [Brevibacillus formosus]PSK16104.1 PAS domain-containing sensor histidine kinase [Brevibacillus sp. NRRL NRS-603]